MDWRSAWFTF